MGSTRRRSWPVRENNVIRIRHAELPDERALDAVNLGVAYEPPLHRPTNPISLDLTVMRPRPCL